MPTKLLYVEDEVMLGKIVSESLEQRGYQVKWLTDGKDALAVVNRFSPDLCILDVMLPHVSGFEAGKSIRAEFPQLPIIYLTAKDQTEDVVTGFASGGNDYVRKPFSLEELIVRIENLLRVMQQTRQLDDVVHIGKCVFSPGSMELTTTSEILRLSHREAELLKVLIRHQNLVVERKHILKEVWGDDSFFNSRNLDVYITKLRKYLKEDPTVEIITLKGVGYQFVVR